MSLTFEEILTEVGAMRQQERQAKCTLRPDDLTAVRYAEAEGLARVHSTNVLNKLFRAGKLERRNARDETGHFIYAYRLPEKAKPIKSTRRKP
jgi:hypothetical protein